MPRIEKRDETNQRLKWNEWRQQEVSKDLFNFLTEKVNEKAVQWADGHFNGNDLHSFVAQHAAAQGAVEVLRELLSLAFEDIYQIEGEESDRADQQERNSPNWGSRPYLPRRD